MNRPVRAFASSAALLLACTLDVSLGRLAGTDSDDAGGSSSTGASGEVCGDGVVQGDEQCDNAGDDADGCLGICEIATSCRQILGLAAGAADGVYTIDPDGADPSAAFAVYCDMTSDGGGWTLLAKVHRWHAPPNYDEPPGWLAVEHDTAALLDALSYEDRLTANASHGEARMDPLIASVDLARFTLIAEDDVLQRASWFKEVDAGIWAWFSSAEHAATLVCSDIEMRFNCTPGEIRSTGERTELEGMFLSHHDYTDIEGNLPIHVRLNGDGYFYPSAVCSSTENLDDNAWHDDAIDGHWGNGLEIWLR